MEGTRVHAAQRTCLMRASRRNEDGFSGPLVYPVTDHPQLPVQQIPQRIVQIILLSVDGVVMRAQIMLPPQERSNLVRIIRTVDVPYRTTW